jgi:hypothetical protein
VLFSPLLPMGPYKQHRHRYPPAPADPHLETILVVDGEATIRTALAGAAILGVAMDEAHGEVEAEAGTKTEGAAEAYHRENGAAARHHQTGSRAIGSGSANPQDFGAEEVEVEVGEGDEAVAVVEGGSQTWDAETEWLPCCLPRTTRPS